MKKKKLPQLLDNNPTLRWIWFCLLLIFPIVLWALPADFFDESGMIMCPSRLFLGIECLGCGITRATMHLHHFELEDALYFNPLVVLVYPGLVVVWFSWVWKNAKALRLTQLVGIG